MTDQNSSSGSKIDLSSVPEPMRSMLLKQLDKMPASLREQLLREGSPVRDRLIAKLRDQARQNINALPPSAAESTPVSNTMKLARDLRSNSIGAATERVQTVRAGDSARHGLWLLGSAIALAGALWYALLG